MAEPMFRLTCILVLSHTQMFLISLQQTTFENLVAKGEIAHVMINISFCHKVFNSILKLNLNIKRFSKKRMISKSTAVHLLYVGNG